MYECTSTLKTTRVLSRRLKLSVLSIRSRRSLLSEFQAVELATANARVDAQTSRDYVETQEVMMLGRMIWIYCKM